MNAEFHYYAIHALALRAGYPGPEARSIALASQFVDDAIHPYEILEAGEAYLAPVTQNYLFWDETTMRDIYLPFHFLPGDPERTAAERADGQDDPFSVTPDSPIAKELLIAALRTGNPYRIGIALHAYADTWAHQHFSSRVGPTNVLDPASPLPPAGHLQALRQPDEALGTWTDPRLRPEHAAIDNRERFLAAARKIYRYLRTARREGFEDEDSVLDELAGIWARDGRGAEERRADFSIAYDIEPYDRTAWLAEAGIVDQSAESGRAAGYDKLLWLRAELSRRAGGEPVRRVGTAGRFFGSPLHRWYEAARAHREAAMAILARAGLDPGRTA